MGDAENLTFKEERGRRSWGRLKVCRQPLRAAKAKLLGFIVVDEIRAEDVVKKGFSNGEGPHWSWLAAATGDLDGDQSTPVSLKKSYNMAPFAGRAHDWLTTVYSSCTETNPS